MSNFIAWGGGTGSSLTCNVNSRQAYGTLQVFGSGYVIGSAAQRYVTGVTDSKGGNWVSDSRRIGTNTATDPSGNTLSSGPSFIRTDKLGVNDLHRGDTVTTTWSGPCDNNIFVVCQIGGILDTLATQYDALSLEFGFLSPIPEAPYNNNKSRATNASSNNVSWSRGIALASPNLAELITFVAIQPGWTSWGSHYGTLIDLYVSDAAVAPTPGTLTIAASQRNVRSYYTFDPGGQVATRNSAPFNPNIILASYQIYDDPLFFNSAPGPVGIVKPGGGGPPSFVVSSKVRR